MPALFEIFAQFPVIVDLAIKNHPHRAVFISHRLMAATQIDNAQTPHSESASAIYQKPFVIGAAVADPVADGAYRGQLSLFVPQHETRNPAHESMSPSNVASCRMKSAVWPNPPRLLSPPRARASDS
jgi:hypothetical protein